MIAFLSSFDTWGLLFPLKIAVVLRGACLSSFVLTISSNSSYVLGLVVQSPLARSARKCKINIKNKINRRSFVRFCSSVSLFCSTFVLMLHSHTDTVIYLNQFKFQPIK